MKHMKKILALVLVVMSVVAVAFSASATTKWVIGSGYLNLRSARSDESTRLDRIAPGLPVTYYSIYNGWSYIAFDGTTGYVEDAWLTGTPSGYSTPQNWRQAFGYDTLSQERDSSGFRVKNLQMALIEGGYLYGGLDGDFGPLTEAAVRAYQSAKGLNVDGKVGDYTKSQLWSDYSGTLMYNGFVQ